MAQLPLLHVNESNHQNQLSYDLAIETSPLSPSAYASSQSNHCGLVIREMVTTERNYLSDLSDIIEVSNSTVLEYILLNSPCCTSLHVPRKLERVVKV